MYCWRKETSTKPTVPVGWLWFTLLAVQIYKLNSKLSTQTSTVPFRFKNAIFQHRKNTSSTETEQRHLCRVLHFNCQNLMLINPMTRPAWANYVWPTGYFKKTWLLLDHFQQNHLGYKTVLKLKKVYVFSNVECIFSAKWFSLGNLSLLTNFQKLSTVSVTVTIVHFS